MTEIANAEQALGGPRAGARVFVNLVVKLKSGAFDSLWVEKSVERVG